MEDGEKRIVCDCGSDGSPRFSVMMQDKTGEKLSKCGLHEGEKNVLRTDDGATCSLVEESQGAGSGAMGRRASKHRKHLIRGVHTGAVWCWALAGTVRGR